MSTIRWLLAKYFYFWNLYALHFISIRNVSYAIRLTKFNLNKGNCCFTLSQGLLWQGQLACEW